MQISVISSFINICILGSVEPIVRFVCWSLTSLCHSNGHIETMPAREINLYCSDQDSISVSRDTMIDEQTPASGHDYASDRSAIGAGSNIFRGVLCTAQSLPICG